MMKIILIALLIFLAACVPIATTPNITNISKELIFPEEIEEEVSVELNVSGETVTMNKNETIERMIKYATTGN